MKVSIVECSLFLLGLRGVRATDIGYLGLFWKLTTMAQKMLSHSSPYPIKG